MSQKMKRRLIGGVGFAVILTLFGAIVALPLWSQSAEAGNEAREIVLEIVSPAEFPTHIVEGPK